MKKKRVNFIVVAMVALSMSAVWAQEPTAPAITTTEMDTMPGMDHSQMNHGSTPGATQDGMSGSAQDTGHDMKNMNKSDGMDSAGMSMRGGSAPVDARDPHAYSDGYDFGPIPRPRLADEHNFGSVLVNRLESVMTSDNTSATYDLQAWYGRDYDRVVLKAEGDIDNGTLEEASTELLWGYAVATFWDTQLGVRYDSGEGPDRTWLALGIQGLAPYWFEVDATAYIGDEGRTALGLEAEYELLLTQKLILQPRIEANAYGKRDPELGIGSGLSDMSAGLRLRYETRREFAPYLGVEWARKFGETKDFARAAGEDPSETRYVAGVRLWF